MLIPLESSSQVQASLCLRVNTDKITTIEGVGYPCLTRALARSEFFNQQHEILSQKKRVFGAAQSEDFVIIAWTVW